MGALELHTGKCGNAAECVIDDGGGQVVRSAFSRSFSVRGKFDLGPPVQALAISSEISGCLDNKYEGPDEWPDIAPLPWLAAGETIDADEGGSATENVDATNFVP